MSERFFRLNGEKWDLEELAYAFEEGPETVKKIDDIHYLRIETESEITDEAAREAADATLMRMNAICLIRDERFRPATIAGQYASAVEDEFALGHTTGLTCCDERTMTSHRLS